MGEGNGFNSSWSPVGAPLLNVQRDEQRSNFDNSVNAVSFGFAATAILIAMFLVMAIFERFLCPKSTAGGRRHGDLESQTDFNGKLGHPSPKDLIFCEEFLHSELGKKTLIVSSFCGLVLIRGISSMLNSPDTQMTVYASGVSVLMPGDNIPSFIAHPVPVPCPPERNPWPHYQHNPSLNPTTNLSS